jgi:hypothetical protein
MGLMYIVFTALNYSKIYYIYNIYSSLNKGIIEKEGVILGYFNIYYMDSTTTYCV